MPVPTLPKDIVAVDSGDRTYMFYVNTKRKLSYLISPGPDGTGDYSFKRIDIDSDDVEVSEKTQQVAAIAWEADGVKQASQIRVYYVNEGGRLNEVCHSSNVDGWYQGSLGKKGTTQYPIVEGSSISATVARRNGDGGQGATYSLRVFASGAGQENDYGVPSISVFTFGYNAKGQATGEVDTFGVMRYGLRDGRNGLRVCTTEFQFIPADAIDNHPGVFPVLDLAIDKHQVSTRGLPWLQHCQHSHSQCNSHNPSMQLWRPTRLLDVHTEEYLNWRLCVTSKDTIPSSPISYLTLSYRWSPTPQIRLLSSNLEKLRQGLPIADLPVLFQDVIYVARQFSIRYIWIDALCIIQDSKDDWERESPMMRHVYSNSVCTIAASGSGSSDDSLFHDRDLDFIKAGKVKSSLFTGQPEPYYIWDRSYFERQILEGGLRTRGWVFQEWFLSPRILYFGRHQLIWECRTLHRCEVFPGGVPGYQSPKQMSMEMVPSTRTENQMPDDKAGLWVDLINQYTKCNLTFPSDRLNAMAGIAKLFEEVTGDQYVAGLWKSRFIELLDWAVVICSAPPSRKYRAPSWSWAHVGGAVEVHNLTVDTSTSQQNTIKHKSLLAELVSVEVVTQTQDKMSTVLSGIAVLKARIVPIECIRTRKRQYRFQGPRCQLGYAVQPDSLDRMFKKGQKVFCMPLIYYEYGNEFFNHMSCLVLDWRGDSPDWPNAYTRLGLLWVKRCSDPASLGGKIQQIELI
ncbi:uncharacterized protein FIESC28_03451 [Fusarium coffeatum]|uniref:Heterokaryon incompatibility domain-containing protein n=1 Tax=Fusarium coffeatum TaxID=231269 RepID=A0A366S4Y4_9HYPO|nr:uncharacterized protein FIESC28_03451 [Fusarium coffeatum]RBR23746.1 hypothetical protein FIESC28_03451 [Fusarium coffeatum]